MGVFFCYDLLYDLFQKAARRRSLHHANLYPTSQDTGTPSAQARLSITSEVGLAVPHSTALIVRTHTPEAKASRSCDHPNSNLLILTFTPIVVDNMTRSLSAGRRVCYYNMSYGKATHYDRKKRALDKAIIV